MINTVRIRSEWERGKRRQKKKAAMDNFDQKTTATHIENLEQPMGSNTTKRKTLYVPLFKATTIMFVKSQIDWTNELPIDPPSQFGSKITRASWSELRRTTDEILSTFDEEISRPLRAFRVTGSLGIFVVLAAWVAVGIVVVANRDLIPESILSYIFYVGFFLGVVFLFFISQRTRWRMRFVVNDANDRFRTYLESHLNNKNNNNNGYGKMFWLIPDDNIPNQSLCVKFSYRLRVDVEEDTELESLDVKEEPESGSLDVL